jgi:hypothetical protein
MANGKPSATVHVLTILVECNSPFCGRNHIGIEVARTFSLLAKHSELPRLKKHAFQRTMISPLRVVAHTHSWIHIHYAIASALGMLPGTIAIVYLGTLAQTLVDAASPIGDTSLGGVMLTGTVAVTLIVAWCLYHLLHNACQESASLEVIHETQWHVALQLAETTGASDAARFIDTLFPRTKQ